MFEDCSQPFIPSRRDENPRKSTFEEARRRLVKPRSWKARLSKRRSVAARGGRREGRPPARGRVVREAADLPRRRRGAATGGAVAEPDKVHAGFGRNGRPFEDLRGIPRPSSNLARWSRRCYVLQEDHASSPTVSRRYPTARRSGTPKSAKFSLRCSAARPPHAAARKRKRHLEGIFGDRAAESGVVAAGRDREHRDFTGPGDRLGAAARRRDRRVRARSFATRARGGARTFADQTSRPFPMVFAALDCWCLLLKHIRWWCPSS